MKNYQKSLVFLILFGLFLNIHTSHSQTNTEVNTYKWFDKTVGQDNLDLNNGTPFTNTFRTQDGSHLFLTDSFELGKVTYENQNYYDVKLKYDTYRDILVLNPFGQSENIGISLIQNKISSFSIKDLNFVKIDRKIETVPEFTTGYYEEIKFAADFVFYIKHRKIQLKTLSETGVYYNFKEDNTFFVDLKGTVYQIKGKNDILKLFPEQKKQINGFYLMNREQRKSDLNLFMKNLMKYISNSLSIQTK
ncbi:hypothetical protein BD847_2073 [Flavobacterium cutihirudinis]|uniref:DKNYY family protein n=1 Tax=Flavobacterium cutihirudinis TaxID=1265740 RepID=A0A3D9FX60_9FLAO|nr:hypothetical protein [Flavobacterium cutihirudinis]RED25323.1 hypothetical protein BD847_2073 [Flavobacterium cutihirudinis]